MAYTGINKAQFESQKFNIEADARRNTVSTIANTTLSVGQTLIQNSMQDKLEELNNQAEIDLSKEEAAIYADTDPEEWEERINTLYAEYGESVTSESKMWPTVKKQFKKGLETRKSRKISTWNAQKKQDEVAATQAHNTNQLNGIIQSQDVVKYLQSSGIIYEKGYTGKQAEEEPTLSDGFVSAGDSRIGGEAEEEGESMVFSSELQEAYNNGASRFDLSVMAIEHYAKKLHPFNEKLQQDTINKYTNDLKDTMPNNDLTTVFNATFSDKNVNNWDFSTFMREYKAGLENETYGGEPLSETKKNELITQAGKMWDSLVAQKTKEAADFYENNIKNPMQELKTAQATNSNNLYFTEDVNAVYDKALKDNPVHAKFLMAQKEADLTIARNNERIQMQRDFKRLYSLGGERSEEQNQKLIDISANFSQEELLILKQQSLSEANVIQELKDFEKSPYSYQTEADLFESTRAKIATGGFSTRKELDSAIKSSGFSSEMQDALMGEGEQYFSRQAQYKAETAQAADNFLASSRNDGTLKLSTAKAWLDENNIEDPVLRESIEKAARSFSMETATNAFYKKFNEGPISEADFDAIMAENEIEDEQFIAGLNEIRTNKELNEANNEVFGLINSEEFSGEGLQTIIDKYGVEDERVINTWETMLENHNLSTLSNSLEALDKDDNLTIDQYEAELEKSGVDYQENAGMLNQYRAKARQNSFNSANNELGTMLYRGSLSKGRIDEVAEKYGLTVEENPDFFNAWKNQAEAHAQDNAIKVFNSMNYDDSLTTAQAKSILDTYGITKEDPLYKQMMDTAEENYQNHLRLDGEEAQGFSGKENSDGDALKSVRTMIGEFSNGNIDKSDVISHLIEQKSNLTETDYKELYNEINNEHLIKKAQSDATFEDKVFRPYLSEQDTIMPGMTDQRMREAGLDPLDFADDATYLQMKDAEVINQHIAYVDQYTDNQMYLALVERGLSDESIKELGFSIPDTSFQNTLQWAKEHQGEKPIGRKEYAQQLIGEAKGKMISGNLPSGRSYGGSSTASSLDETIAKSADRIYEGLLDASKIGARYDDPDAVSNLNLMKFSLDDKEYDALAYEKLVNGEITEKTYLAAINEDVSVYKSPEYRQVQEAMKIFSKYTEEKAGFGYDKDGKKVPASSLLTDKVVQNFKAAFLDEYQYALNNANGAFVDPNVVAERVYNELLDAEYTKYADKTMEILQNDSTVMYTNVFGRETASKAAYTDFASGQLNRYDPKVITNLLSDPSNPDAGFGSESSKFGMWLTKKRNGSSDEEIGNEIAYDVARAMGFEPPPLDGEDFEKKFETFLNELPPISRAQWEQASLVSKWTLDVYNLAKSEIDPEIVRQLDPEGTITPFVMNNQMGVEIGGERFFYNDGGKKGDRGFVYAHEDSTKTLSSEASVHEKSKASLEEGIKDTFVMDQYGIGDKYARDYLFSGDDVDVDKVENYLDGLITRKASLLGKKGEAYVSSLNAKAEDIESLTGNAGKYYSGLEYKVDRNALKKAKEDGTIQTKPLSSFITYTLVPAIH
jgi:hypothetical protein